MSSPPSRASRSSYHHTYWCSECDMSIPLSISPTPTRCPHCQNCFLEHMDTFPPIAASRAYLQRLMRHLATTASPGSPRLSRAAIQSLKTIAVPGDSSESCPICKDHFAVATVANELPCGHVFHSGCILPWLQINSTCPLCRFRLVSHGEGDGDDFETRAMTLDELLDDGDFVDDDDNYENELRQLIRIERGLRHGGRMVFSPSHIVEEVETELPTTDVDNVARA